MDRYIFLHLETKRRGKRNGGEVIRRRYTSHLVQAKLTNERFESKTHFCSFAMLSFSFISHPFLSFPFKNNYPNTLSVCPHGYHGL